MEENANAFLLQQSYFIEFLNELLKELQITDVPFSNELCETIEMLLLVEESFTSQIQKAIEHSPPLLIAKFCYEDVKLLRIMSIFLFTERPKIYLTLGQTLSFSDYFQLPGPDVFVQLACRRINEYSEFFESLSVICPEDHPDYYHRSLVTKEIKSLNSTNDQKLYDIQQYQLLQTTLGSIKALPVGVFQFLFIFL